MGQSRPLFVIFVLFTFQFKWQIYNLNNINWKSTQALKLLNMQMFLNRASPACLDQIIFNLGLYILQYYDAVKAACLLLNTCGPRWGHWRTKVSHQVPKNVDLASLFGKLVFAVADLLLKFRYLLFVSFDNGSKFFHAIVVLEKSSVISQIISKTRTQPYKENIQSF